MVFLKHVHRRNPFIISFRQFSQNVSEPIHESSASKQHLNKKRGTEVYNYLKDIKCEHLFPDIPYDFITKKSIHKRLLINPQVARIIYKTLSIYVEDGYVLESDPGFGFLSKDLVHKVSHLRLYEENDLLRSYLREFADKHREKIEIFDQSLLSVHKLLTEDQMDRGNRINLLFNDVPTDIRLSMIMMIPHKNTVTKWIYHILLKNYFSKFSQLDFYFFIPPSIYTRLIASPQNDYYPRYQKFSVLSQVLFDIKLLINDIPRKSILPWPSRSITKQRKRDVEKYENDHDVVYLVRMSLKQENLSQLQDEKMYQCFSSFISQNMVGKRRIIPYFETIIPGSGPRVIMLGHNIYSTFNELNPDEIFSLFLQFTKWPEFQHSAFYSFWKNFDTFDDHEAPAVESANSHDDDTHLHDEDDNDDEAFSPENKLE